MNQAIKVLKQDPVFNDILHVPIAIPEYNGDVKAHLFSSIISQQLSVHSARAIYNRFKNHFGGPSPFPYEILNTSTDTFRTLGISNNKTQYIRNVATFFDENKILKEDWKDMTNDDIISKLVEIKGVGVWTVQMVLIFCLARKDIFPIGDLGVRNAIIELYGLEGKGKPLLKEIRKIAEPWSPFRSIASLYLWSWLNWKSGNG